MRITESQLRRIVREERARLQEMGMGMGEADLERAGAALHAALEAYYSAAATALGGHEAALEQVQDFCEDFIVEYR